MAIRKILEQTPGAKTPNCTSKYFQRDNARLNEQPSLHEVSTLSLIDTMSDGPDEIFDMAERYGSNSDEAERDESYSDEARDEFVDRAFQCGGTNERDQSETLSDTGTDGYIANLFDNLNFRGMITNLQGQASIAVKQASDSQPGYEVKMQTLEKQLLREAAKSQKLALLLEESQKKQEIESKRKDQVISSLEAQLALQQSTFTNQLASQKKEIAILEDKLKTKEGGAQRQEQPHNSLVARIKELEREVSRLEARRVSLEASLENRQSTYDYYINSANTKLKDVEGQYEMCRKNLESERVQSKKLEVTLAKAEAILKLDRKKMGTLQLSESRTKLQLEAERRRANSLEKVNNQMKEAMTRLTRKASSGMGGAKEQIESIQRRLNDQNVALGYRKKLYYDSKRLNIMKGSVVNKAKSSEYSTCSEISKDCE